VAFDERIAGGKTMTFKPILLAVLMASLIVSIPVACGEEGDSPATTWREAARQSGLTPEDISALDKNRILITDEAYKQVFSAYFSEKNPSFITSDSLLNAYHILYEESVLRLENVMSRRLPPILQRILKNIEDTDNRLEGNPALVSAAKRRARLVTGIGLGLIDDSFRFNDDELDTILTEEISRIVKAKGRGMPSWLGSPDPSFLALDYSRYMPRGFYTRSESLKRYFRAVSWLQSIPFRVEKDKELLAMLMLGTSVRISRSENSTIGRETQLFFRAYTSFIGAVDDWDLITASRDADLEMNLSEGHLERKQATLLESAKGPGVGPLINDQIRFPTGNPEKAAEPNFRIISAYRTPSAILFQRTTDIRKFGRGLPDGLEVCISLGSAFARKNLKDSQKTDLLKTIDSCKTFFEGSSLYFAYLDALKALLDTPDHDVPDFMKGEAWQAKNCNTVLAGWAQLRHTWVLQAKQSVTSLGGGKRGPVGFVEPEPEFFERMAELADKTQDVLKQAGAFDPDYGPEIACLEKFSGILEGVTDEVSFRNMRSELGSEERRILELPLRLMTMNTPEAERGSEAFYKEQRQWIELHRSGCGCQRSVCAPGTSCLPYPAIRS